MKNYTRILSILTLALLTIALPVSAQEDNKNKAIVETTEGTQQLNTDDISVIRFDSGKITIEQPWGNTTYDRTLRSLTFFRPLPGTLRLTATTDISANNGGNRAQSIDGDGKLKATWEEGDVVYVYADASSTAYIGTLTPKTTGASTATLTGDINAEGLSNGQDLYFSTKDRATFNLTSQDGTVESLFYFEATAPITIDGGNASVGDLSFARPIAVVKFSLKDKGNSDAPISATSLTVSDGTNIYNVTPSSATAVLYVGIPAISGKTITLNTTDGSKYYYYQKTGVTFTNNEYYAINVKMNASELARPLTFEAKADGFTVTLTSDMNPLPSLDYSIDGGAWITYTCNAATPSVNTGHTISFRAKTTNVAFADNNPHISTFECNKDCYIYGNIMSLLSVSGYATATSVGEMAFVQLFEDNENIYSHDTKELLLPATTLANYCYHAMFSGCTNLTTAPELPATTLANYCYHAMFAWCTNLTTAPELPATTLADNCYSIMFQDCTSLATAPELPATTLAVGCYSGMFLRCTSLTTAPVLPATTLASKCYKDMFQGCTSLTTAPALPATTLASQCYYQMFQACTGLTTAPALPAKTLANYCYMQMFYGCTHLTTAPSLPAATLVQYCYYRMFYNCSSLNSVTCLATDISAQSCTSEWLRNVASSGTFTKSESMTGWTSGVNGIPSGWTVKSIPTGALLGKFTINGSSNQVRFSKGNLQYTKSTSTWSFMEHQYSTVETNASPYCTDDYGDKDVVSLFGWATSGYNHGATCYQPYSTNTTCSRYYAYGTSSKNLYDQTGQADWGYNAISNGGNTENSGWRTLTRDEWVYLFNTRTTGGTVFGTSSARYAHATIRTDVSGGVNGIILFPDGLSIATSEVTTAGTVNGNSEWGTKCTSSQWTALAAKGCVFLPAAGERFGDNDGVTVRMVGSNGCYWASTYYTTDNGGHVAFGNNFLSPYGGLRRSGHSVRLVRDAE